MADQETDQPGAAGDEQALAPSTEEPLDQKVIPFMGDDLVAVLTASEDIYISLPGMCRALGLSTQPQLRRIQRSEVLARGLRRISLDTPGGRQEANCLRVDKLALWLAGVETSRIKEEYRAKVIAYQEELAPVAMRVFLRFAGIPTTQLVPATDPRLAALAEQYDTLMDVASFLREHMEAIRATGEQMAGISIRLDEAVQLLESLTSRQQALATRQDDTEVRVARIDERTQGLSPAHQRQIQTAVDRMVRETQHNAVPLTYAIIYGRLKSRFLVGSYKEIADEKFEDVLAYLAGELRRATGGRSPEQGRLF